MKIPKVNIFKNNKLKVHEVSDQLRNRNLLRQISSSIILKGISVGISLMLVPILLDRLGSENYGIWVILLSLMQWIALMDIGIGNGLRNKLTEALALNKVNVAKEYMATAYYSMGLFGLALIMLLAPVIYYLDWNSFFNSKGLNSLELRWSIMIFVISIVFYFVLSLVNQAINAVQRNSLTSIAPIIGNLFFITSVIVLSGEEKLSLLSTIVAYSVCVILSILIVSYLFYKEYEYLIPNFVFFRRSRIRLIMNLGIKFFIIQITCVVIFSTDNFIITQLFGPNSVTIYSIPFLVFNNIGMLINLLMMPFYSSYTEAYSKNNLSWIREKILLLCKLMLPFIFFILVVVFIYPYIIEFWITSPVNTPALLPLLIGIYTIVCVWNNIFSYVLNSTGKINLSMYIAIFQGVLNVPLSIYLAKYCGLGLNGVVISNIICLGISSIIAPIQVYYFIFGGKRSPRWDRLLG